MRFRHQFLVLAPLSAVAEFHREAASLPAITPPPLTARLESSPGALEAGDLMAFTLGVGPFRTRWVASIDETSPNGFVDRQISGPFASWVHRHGFTGLDGNTTEVVDRIEATLRPHLVYGPLGLAMWVTLPVLFAYRGWKTRRLLGQRQEVPAS